MIGFDNDQWNLSADYRVMNDQGFPCAYFNDRQEAINHAYNQSQRYTGRWQVRSRTYGFEEEYTRGILQEFRRTCSSLGCLERPTKQHYQHKFCDTCHARITRDETAGR
jgi:hypothetical protein